MFSTLLGIGWLGDDIGGQEILGMLVIVVAGLIGSLNRRPAT